MLMNDYWFSFYKAELFTYMMESVYSVSIRRTRKIHSQRIMHVFPQLILYTTVIINYYLFAILLKVLNK